MLSSWGELDLYKQRYLARGSTPEYADCKIGQYEDRLKLYNSLDVEKMILKNNETLEDYLLRKNYKLKLKEGKYEKQNNS